MNLGIGQCKATSQARAPGMGRDDAWAMIVCERIGMSMRWRSPHRPDQSDHRFVASLGERDLVAAGEGVIGAGGERHRVGGEFGDAQVGWWSGGVRVSGERGDGGVELAAAHGGEQVSGVILAHADRDGWVGAAELAEGAMGDMGDPPGPTGPPYAARRRFARRLSVHSGR
jgi:hypothetical protein